MKAIAQCTLEQREKLINEFVEMGASRKQIDLWMNDKDKLSIINALAASNFNS